MFLLSSRTDFAITALPFKMLAGLVLVLAAVRFAAPRFFFRYLWSHDHKMIGKQFLVSGLLWAVVGGALALAVRQQLGYPGSKVPVIHDLMGWPDAGMPGEGYSVMFTMHATIMIFFVIIPLLVGAFGNFVVPLMIGARDMAFPFLNALSYWLMWPAFIFMTCSFMVPGEGAGAGWTSYSPLANMILGDGQTLWCWGVWFVGWSSICGAVNYITTIVKMRAKGLHFFRLPLTVWSVFITSILVLCATPVLGSAVTMLIADRSLGTSFFVAPGRMVGNDPVITGGGHSILWQHLFWFYSHPAVYIMVLPAMGMVSDMMAAGVRKAVFGYRPMVYSICGIAFLGFIVWGHHMFQSGMNPALGRTFMIATMMIALPSAVKTFNWLGTLHRSQMRFEVHTLCTLAFVAMWIVGGLSGIFMAATPVDIQIHDTYAIVAHIHYVVFGATLFAVFGGIYYWFPKMFGRFMDKRMALAHFFLTFIFFQGTFFPMHIVGSRGMLRRTADAYVYPDLQGMLPMNHFMTICAFLLGATQLILAVNFFWSMFRGRRCESRNPWKATTLEWATPTPPVDHGNFDVAPEAHRGPYEYARPDVDDDYLPQFAPPAARPAPAPAHAVS
jgi:cytochrome c oxidase subunit 1